MTNYTIVPTTGFERELDKLSVEDQTRTLDKITVLEKNPFYPSLRSKKLKGYDDLYESSVNMSIRIIWAFDDDEVRTIDLLDVGHHDILKKY